MPPIGPRTGTTLPGTTMTLRHRLLAHDAMFVGSYAFVVLSFLIFWGYTSANPMPYAQWIAVADLFERCALTYSVLAVAMTASVIWVRDRL